MRHFINVLDLLAALAHHAICELLICARHPIGDEAALLVCEGLVAAEEVGVFASGETFCVQAHFVEEILEDELAADDADAADDGTGISDDVIAGACEVITAAGGHAADADDQRLVLGGASRGLPHHF